MLSFDESRDQSAPDRCNPMLQEIYRPTISLHHAKAAFHYPIIRLPHTFSVLAGLCSYLSDCARGSACLPCRCYSLPRQSKSRRSKLSALFDVLPVLHKPFVHFPQPIFERNLWLVADESPRFVDRGQELRLCVPLPSFDVLNP